MSDKNLLPDLLTEGDNGRPIVSDRDGSERRASCGARVCSVDYTHGPHQHDQFGITLIASEDAKRPFLVNENGQRWEFPTFDVIDERTAEDFKVLYHSEHVYRMDEQRQRLAAEDERNDLRARAWDLELIVTRAEGLGHRTVPIEEIRKIYPRE